ncbi:c-type cytochrome [Loktanella salsilacus]|uniref:c-type cytochrome n=1 Tax=Loktanella salsilacus TaxID=195913 RepID=UPI0030027D2D
MLRIYALAVITGFYGSVASAESHAATEAEQSEAPAVIAEDVDLDAAKSIFTRSCRGCHGNKAQGVASYPKLSDKTPEYIVEKLETYRAGERIGPNSVLMIQNAKGLSDLEIASLAVYVTTAFE